MRKVVHLESCEYIIPIGHKTGQLSSLSSKYQSTLQKVGSSKFKDKVDIFVHARINKGTFDSLKLIGYFKRRDEIQDGIVNEFKIYKVDNAWNETLIGTYPAVLQGGKYVAEAPQSDFLPANDLSGAESYAIIVQGVRRGNIFAKKEYFNDLWIF